MKNKHGREITPEIIEGLRKFTSNDVKVKLKYESESIIFYEVDEAWSTANESRFTEDEMEFFELLTPYTQHNVALYPPVGAVLYCSLQYAGEIFGEETIGWDYKVIRHEWGFEQSTSRCWTYLMVYLEPVIEEGT